MKGYVLSVILLTITCAAVNAASTGGTKPTTKSVTTVTTTKPAPVTTTNATQTTAGECSQYTGGDCDSCVSKSKGKCAYCNEEKICLPVLSKGIFSESKLCKGGLSDISWGTCSVNMLALIIGVSVVGGLLLISLCTCICCCCCCKDSAKQKLKWMKQDAANARKTEERKAKYAERRAERQVKNDEIRKKYGLFKGEQGGYQRMEDDDA